MSGPFVVSIPKSGTHLLWHILGFNRDESARSNIMLPVKDGYDFAAVTQSVRVFPNGISGHVLHSPTIARWLDGFVTCFLYRHPGDIVVSWKHHVENFPPPSFTRAIPGIEDHPDPLTCILEQLHKFLAHFLGWLNEDAIPIRYETLLQDPDLALMPLAKALNRPLDLLVERSRYRGGKTYRTGKTGNWRREFSAEQMALFEQNFGDIVKELGYGP